MIKIDCTVILSVKNEELNISNCLINIVNRFERIVVVDSYSNDKTKSLVDSFGVECVDFNYEPPYPKKRQWAIENLDITTPWVLLLDADEIVGDDLFHEILELSKSPKLSGIFIKKKFYFMGKRLKYGGFDFNAMLMFRHGHARFEELSSFDNGYDMEIHERVICSGQVVTTSNGVEHMDWNTYHHYVNKHNVYASWDADVRLNNSMSDNIQPKILGNVQERRRFLKSIVKKMPFEPFIWFFYHYIVRFGFLGGRRGLIASFTRALYIFIIKVKIYECKINSKDKS